MSSAPPLRQFTEEDLAAGDGREGRPALVAYKGKVYDCTPSKLWKNGKHVNAHMAGQDLTLQMASAPHADDVMARFPVVGVLAEAAPLPAAATHEAPPIVSLFLAQHPHPITVHAPTAMGSFASLFMVLHYVFGGPLAHGRVSYGAVVPVSQTLEDVAFWLVLITAVTAPVGTATGLLSWWFNYRGVASPLYKWKIRLSLLLIALAWGAVFVRLKYLHAFLAAGFYPNAPLEMHLLYFALVLFLAPTVIALGRLGGKIVYP